MELESRKERGAVIVTARGELDSMASGEFDRHLGKWLSKKETFFVIDFSGLEYISSAGLRVIVAAVKTVKPNNGKIHFVGIHGHVLEVFRMSYFLNLFELYDKVEDALNNIRPLDFVDHLQLYGGLECQGKLLDFVSSHLQAIGIDPMRTKDIRLAVEEILSNIFEHAYHGEKGEYELSCKKSPDKYVIEISDSGKPFDMTIHQGGMGTFLIKKLISHIEYRRVENRNILTLILPQP